VRQPTNDFPEPTLLIEEPDFRLVRVQIGADEEHVLEVRDGKDAMGNERWRKFETRGSKNLEAIFGYLVRIATKQEQSV
jgi:hypothetical protein